MDKETLRQQLYDSFKNRALIYYRIYEELSAEVGASRAEEILSRAIYRRGTEKGREKYARYAPNDLAGLQKAFFDGIPDEGQMFKPEVINADESALDIKFHDCPLR
ncbi:MAG: L-2-amino-thiazoline-4-carboxylic acid hydrolase, partial [Thermoguttaceae bacterium]